MKKYIALSLFILSQASFASDPTQGYLEFFLQNLNNIRPAVNCDAEPETKVSVKNCSEKHVSKIDSSLNVLFPKFRQRMIELENYGKKKLTSADQIFYKKVKKTFSCVQKEIDKKLKFECIESYLCNEPYNYYMYTSPTPDQVFFKDKTIRLCPKVAEDKSEFVAGIILHEVSHLCGTEDLDYLSHRNMDMNKKPKLNYENGAGETNADSIRYWYEKGFCIPEKDC